MRNTRLTPSERLILHSIKQAANPANPANILDATCVSIHTLVPALSKLRKLGHIVAVNLGDGPRYSVPPTDSIEAITPAVL